jgi:hypothetical protein
MKAIQWLAITSVIALAGCSDKPPGCADDETRSTAKELIVSEALKHFNSDDRSYMNKSSVDLSNIVDDGVRKESKQQMCKAHVKVLPPDGDGLEADTSYSTQRVLDKDGRFVLEMENADQLALALVSPAFKYFQANHFLGTYGGTYSCSAIAGATDGPRGPFNMPVSMVVAAQGADEPPRATLERVSKGGGVEQLVGHASSAFLLAGSGENTPDDRWFARFDVTIKGNHAEGSGEISTPESGLLRHCTLDLTKGAVSTNASATSSGPSTTSAPQAAPTTPAGVSKSADGQMNLSGKYVGDGDGTVTVDVGQPSASGAYPVSLSTQATSAGGGGCGGGVTGEGRIVDGALRVTATDKTVGETCSVTLTPDGKGGFHSEEGKGCSIFHGAACDFSADLSRINR